MSVAICCFHFDVLIILRFECSIGIWDIVCFRTLFATLWICQFSSWNSGRKKCSETYIALQFIFQCECSKKNLIEEVMMWHGIIGFWLREVWYLNWNWIRMSVFYDFSNSFRFYSNVCFRSLFAKWILIEIWIRKGGAAIWQRQFPYMKIFQC